MKQVGVFILAFVCLALSACKDDIASAGADALSDDEQVRVCATTLQGISSVTDTLPDFQITQTPDSFLVGECNTDDWRTIGADLMTQFACPEEFVFPDSSTVDSVMLMMTYRSWVGDGYSPLRLSVYELDKATFRYDHVYTSQEDVSAYWSGADSTHLADYTVVAAKPVDSIYSSDEYLPYLKFKLADRFVRKMNGLKRFPSQEQFNQFIKGIYIRPTYGASTALYLNNITMVVYYHYTYLTEGEKYNTANDTKYLYANSEVRQVNRYVFPDKKQAVDSMRNMGDSLNFIVSPGYVYSLIKLPINKYVQAIQDSMAVGSLTMRPYINKAVMRIDVLNAESESAQFSTWATPAESMLLVLKDSVNDFFRLNKLPSDDYCLLGTLTSSLDEHMNYYYYYDFNVSTMLQNALRSGKYKDDIELVMVPVDVEYSSTSSATVISKVKINQTVTSTIIRSATHALYPINIDAVFSGFTISGIH